MAVLADPPEDIQTLSEREIRLLTSFVWLKNWQKTPADLGLPWDRVDRLYGPAMLWIQAGYEAQRAFELDRDTPSMQDI